MPTSVPTVVPSETPSPTPTVGLLCQDVNIKDQQFSIDGNAAKQKRLIIDGSKELLRKKPTNSTRVYTNKLMKAAFDLYQESWGRTWTIPSIVTQCDSSETCVQVSITGDIGLLRKNSDGFQSLISALSKKLKNAGLTKKAKEITNKGNALHSQNISLLNGLPTFSSNCN